MGEDENDHEARLRETASKLFFTLKITVLGSGCTEMSTSQSPFGMTVSHSMK
jgi:hypothetical protein